MSFRKAAPRRDHDREPLSGLVERVTFHSPETGFCVLRVKAWGHRDLVTVVGSAASIQPGEFIQASGQWDNHRDHGVQFKTTFLKAMPPSSLHGIEKYLGSGMIKGIGPHFAKKLVEAFGEEVFDVIENAPERLRKLEGIGPKRVEKITSGWAEQKAIREIMVFLQSHGVGTSRAVRIFKTYGVSVRLTPTRRHLLSNSTESPSSTSLANWTRWPWPMRSASTNPKVQSTQPS